MKLSDKEFSFEGVVDLIVKQQFINYCSKELLIHLIEKKFQRFRELAAIVEQYLTAYNKKLSSRDFNSKKSACALIPEVKNANAFSATIGDLKGFCCENLKHRSSERFLCVQDKG